MQEGNTNRPTRSGGRRIDLQGLELFVRVCETGNMTDAGAMLGMTQSAVSHAIKNMEQLLNVTLFDRAIRPVVVTAAGNVLRRHAEQLLQQADLMIGLVRHSGTSVIPYFGIGIISSFAVSVGPKLVSSIYGHASEFSIFSGAAPILRKALVHRQADAIITSERLDDLENVDVYRLMREPYLVVMSKASSAKYGDLPLHELARRFPLIRYSASTFAGGHIERHFRRIRLETVSYMEMDTSDAILAMVLDNLGWTVTTPLALVRSLAGHADLSIKLFPEAGFSRLLSLVVRRGELAGLPRKIAALSRDLLRQDVVRALERQFPDITEQMITY